MPQIKNNQTARTESNLAELLPAAQILMRRFLVAAQAYLDAKAPGTHIELISGYRSFAEQSDLYAQGRTKPGKIVTKARAGFSWHNWQTAGDIGLFQGSKYLADSPLYAALGPIGRAVGLEWGGDWKSIKDMPHYQLPLGISLAEANRRKAAGMSVLFGTKYQDWKLETSMPEPTATSKPEAAPAAATWTVQSGDKRIVVDSADTDIVRQTAQLLGYTVSPDAKKKLITLSK